MKKPNSLIGIGLLTLFTVVGGLLVTAGLASADTADSWKNHSYLCRAESVGGTHESFAVLGKNAFGDNTLCRHLEGPTELIGNAQKAFVPMVSMGTCGSSEENKDICKAYDMRITSVDIDLAKNEPYQTCVLYGSEDDVYIPWQDCQPLMREVEPNHVCKASHPSAEVGNLNDRYIVLSIDAYNHDYPGNANEDGSVRKAPSNGDGCKGFQTLWSHPHNDKSYQFADLGSCIEANDPKNATVVDAVCSNATIGDVISLTEITSLENGESVQGMYRNVWPGIGADPINVVEGSAWLQGDPK